MGVAPSIPVDQAVVDDQIHQQQEEEEQISRTNSLQGCVPVLTMSPGSSCNSIEEHAEDDQHEHESCSLHDEEQEQDEQELFPSLQRSQSFELHDHQGLGPAFSTQHTPFSNDSEVSSLVSASFTCTPRVMDVYQTFHTNQTILASSSTLDNDDPALLPCLPALPFRRCNRLRCHCRLWSASSLELSMSNSTTNSIPVNNNYVGARTRVRARSEEYTSHVLAISSSPPVDAYAHVSSSITRHTPSSSPPCTTRKPMNLLPCNRKQQQRQRQHLPYVCNKQRSRSEDVVDITLTATACTDRRLSSPYSSSSSRPPLDSPPRCRRINTQSESGTGREGVPKKQPSEPPSRRPVSKSQSERGAVVLQPNPKLRSRSQNFVDGHAPCNSNQMEQPDSSSNSRRTSLSPNRERINQSDFTPCVRANSEAASAASSNSSSGSSSSVCIEQQLAPKKYSSERSLSVFTRSEASLPRLRCRSEDLVDVPNCSHQHLRARHYTNTQTATASTESPKRSKRYKNLASPTSVRHLSSAAVSLAASEESSQQPNKYKLPTVNREATLDELLQEAFGFESQGNPLLALETYRASLNVSKRHHRRSNTTCNKLIHARIYHRMGLLHYQMGNYHPSLRVLEQAFEVISLSYGCLILQDTLSLISGIRDVCELVAEISLAVARVHLSLGSIRDAKHAAKQGLEIIFNKRSSQVLFHRGLVVLGMVYELEGRWENALSYYQQALSFQQRHHHPHHLGDHHHTSVAATLSCIGNIYTKQGWLGPAIECFRESIRIYSLSKSSALDIGLTLSSIGWIQWWYGDLASATKSTTDALYIVEDGVGSLHRNTCTIRYQLGLIQARQGHSHEALGTLSYVLHAQRLSLSADHDDIAITCDAIGDLYHHQLRKKKKAASFFMKALDIRKRVWGKKHLLVAASYSRLGHVLEQIGNHSESRAYLAKTLAVYQTNQLPLSDFRVQRVQQALRRLPSPPSEQVASP
jgi:tetratricopeptide (TPR) repeat protein